MLSPETLRDLELPQTSQFSTIYIAFQIFVMSGVRNFKFGSIIRLILVLAHGWQNKTPPKGVCQVRWPIKNLLKPHSSNFEHTFWSCDNKLLPNGRGQCHVTHFYLGPIMAFYLERVKQNISNLLSWLTLRSASQCASDYSRRR